MSLERKPLYLTLDSIKQFELPNTASAVGYDLKNAKQLYFNTGSGNWEQITNISASQGSFQYVQLLPVEAAVLPTNITASYIYTSGSTNDIWFTQYSGTGTENTTRLRWLESGLTTGLLYGGVISASNGSTSFSVSSGSGVIVDYNGSLSQDIYTTAKKVSWSNINNQPLIYSGSAQITYVAIDLSGAVVQQNVPFTQAQFLQYIQIGRVLHQTGSVVNGTITSPTVAYGLNAWNSSFNRSIGPLKISGHLLAASGSTLSLTKTAGDYYVEGRNYLVNPSSPNLILAATDTVVTTSKIFYEYVNGSGKSVIDSGIANAGYTIIDITRYNLNGTLTTVPPNKVTIQRVYWFPNSSNRALFVYYGSDYYATLDDAQVAIPTEVFTEGENTLGAAILVAYILVDSNCTSLADTTKARIIQAGQTRSGGGGGGAGLVTPPGGLTTQVQYNNGGVFGGDTGLTYNSTSKTLTAGNLQVTGSAAVTGDITGSNLLLTGNTGRITNLLGPLVISSSVGITTSGSIIISGSRSSLGTEQTSVLVNGDIFVSGGIGTNDYIQLKPVQQLRIPTNTTSSYIYTSGSTNDLYFTQYSGPYTNTTRLRWMEGNLSTGLLNGGVLSTTNGTTTFNITSGSGIIVSFNASTTTDPYPTVKLVSWPVSSSIPLYYSGSSQITYVGIDNTGKVVQRQSPFDKIDYQQFISLGRVLHQAGSVTNGVNTSPFVSYGLNTWSSDFNRAFGPLKISGHTLAPSGSAITLSLTKSAGDSFVEGRNYTVDPNSPNLVLGSIEGAQLTSKIFRIYTNQSGTPTILTNNNNGFTDIEPGVYNPGNLGVTSSVGSGKFTIQRVFWYPNSVTKAFSVYYGTTEYATLDIAQSSIPTDQFVEGGNTAGAAILVAYLIVAYNCTNLNSSTQARILQAGLFRNNGVGGGGGGATTPGGDNTYVQYNNNGVFGGDAGLTYNSTSKILTTTASFALATPQFTDSGNKINTTASFAFAGNLGSNYYASDVGADVFLFVSGASGSKGTSTRGVTVFGGDVVISGTLAGGSPLEVSTEMVFLQPTLFKNQVSGSIFNTVDGLPYLTSSNSNLTIFQNHATKQLEITSSAGGTPTQIQYNNGGLFSGVPSLTYNGSTLQGTGSFSGTFSGSLTGSLSMINGSTPYLVGSGAVNISTASNGQVKILVSQDNGTWTPAFTFGTVNGSHTYSSQVGRYYKIGRSVTANFAIALSSLGTSTGNVSLVNLPFTSEDGVDGSGVGNIIVFKNIAGGANRVVSIGGYVGPNRTSASLYHASAITTDATTLTHANLTATTQLTGSITYISAT